MLRIELPSAGDGSLNEYGYVLALTVWITFQCYMTGFFVAGKKRYSTFTDDYMSKNFGEEHLKAFPKDKRAPKGGYPDTGCGYYASKLSYKQWFELNIAQRIHWNFLEQIIIISLLLLVSGIKHPATTVYLGIAYSIGRFMQAIGYTIAVKGRIPGGAILTFSLLGLFGTATHTLWTIGNTVNATA